MPELPEVEVARRQLVRWLGRQVLRPPRVLEPTTVRARRSTSPSDAHPDGAVALAWLAGRRLTDTARVGKRLALGFEGRWLEVHLGMSGWLARRPRPDGPPRHARVGLETSDAVVWLVDTRRFGCIVPTVDPAGLADGLGPDALDAVWTGDALAARCATRSAVKPALMDQARVAGLGNIQVAEVLFEAGVDPRVPCGALDADSWARLAAALRPVLRRAIEATDTDGDVHYLTQGGANPFRVYGRAGSPCARCGVRVEGLRQQGRMTHWCPGCQVDPRDGGGAGR